VNRQRAPAADRAAPDRPPRPESPARLVPGGGQGRGGAGGL